MRARRMFVGASVVGAGVVAAASAGWACAPIAGAQIDLVVTPTGTDPATGVADGGVPGDGSVPGGDAGPSNGFAVVFSGWATSNSAITVTEVPGVFVSTETVASPKSVDWRVQPDPNPFTTVNNVQNPAAEINVVCDAADPLVSDTAPKRVSGDQVAAKWEIDGTGKIPPGLVTGVHVVCVKAQLQYWWDTVTVF